jgi:hypothetical protein
MEPSTNPYQSPAAVPSASAIPAKPKPMPREDWKYVLLAIAILGGLASFVPWLAIILLILSTPIIIRYVIRSRSALPSGESPSMSVQLAGGLGTAGIVLSVLAASAGACLGTCTITAWGTQLSGVAEYIGDVTFPNGYLADVGVSLYGGGAVGIAAFVTSVLWLFHRHLGEVRKSNNVGRTE